MPEILVYQDRWAQPNKPGHTVLYGALQELGRSVGNSDSQYKVEDLSGNLEDNRSKYGNNVLQIRPRRLDFVSAEIVDLITTGLGGLDDSFAAGFTARNGDVTWTLRWDWDPSKGEHINLTITGSGRHGGTDKLAFLSQPKSDTVTRSAQYMVEAYHLTMNRFTSDSGWNKGTYDVLKGDDKKAYRRHCAAKGRRALAVRVLGREDLPQVPEMRFPKGKYERDFIV